MFYTRRSSVFQLRNIYLKGENLSMANHPIVHIEIPSHDPAAAGKFYADVFGWHHQSDPMYDYHMFQAEGGPGGGFVKASDGSSEGMGHYKIGEVLLYIGADDIDATLAKVEEHGGKTIVPKTEIPHVGWFGIFTDPAGNRMALFSEMSQQS